MSEYDHEAYEQAVDNWQRRKAEHFHKWHEADMRATGGFFNEIRLIGRLSAGMFGDAIDPMPTREAYVKRDLPTRSDLNRMERVLCLCGFIVGALIVIAIIVAG